MKRQLATFLIFVLLSTLANGQKTIIGKVLNKTTHVPIPFANIGILNSNVGTISNMDGSFSILIPERLSHETLIFTSLGYYKQDLGVINLQPNKGYTVYLDEMAIMLRPVVITPLKDIILGNEKYRAGNYEPDTIYAGRAVSLLIDGKNFPKGTGFPVYIKNAKLYILFNSIGSYKFRVRINKYDSLTGKPGEDLLEESIIVESKISNGWLNFDLTKSYFSVKGPFFVTFEQLVDLKGRSDIAWGYRKIKRHPEWFKNDTVLIDNKKVITKDYTEENEALPGTYIGISNSKSAIKNYTCYVRQTSLGEWTKVPIAIAATVTVSCEKGKILKGKKGLATFL